MENAALLPPDHPRPLAGRRYQRSRITNNADLLPGWKGTSAPARRFKDLVNNYIVDSGGIDLISEIKLGLLRRLAAIVVQCELLEASMVNGEKVDITTLCTLSSTALRLSMRLGLERKAKPVETLEEHLQTLKDKPLPTIV
jgi:hypothetical protein